MALSIARFMTKSPHTIGRHATLADARARMNAHGIRHLPVLSGGVLVGLVSQRDVQLLETLKDVDPNEVTVEDAMSQDVLTAAPNDSLRSVAERMARRKAGSAIVVEKGMVLGIFTTIDALKALSGRPAAKRPTTRRKAVSRRLAARTRKR
jgi:acetoin utilization protein AcuB